MTSLPVQTLTRTQAPDLAYHWHKGNAPVLVYMHGWLSDMEGTKSLALLEWARAQNQSCLLFDFSGHGRSAGDVAKRTMSEWRADACAMLDWVANETNNAPLVVIGSSFGGNMAVLASLERSKLVKGLVLIAPAVDMTERLLRPSLTEAMQKELDETGATTLTSPDGEWVYPISQALLEDGAKLSLYDKPSIDISVPVRILHGQQDDSVGWKLSLKLAEKLTSENVRLHYFKRGLHGMSEADELEFLFATCAEVSATL